MWQEARKQEKKIRGMMVDYRRRAERRKDYYEKIKQDPAQFLQIHGRSFKIHLDPQVAAAADSPATMMPWQGNKGILIDRFDVRAHLDYIPPYKGQDGSDFESDHGEKPVDEPKFDREEDAELERDSNYERYRILVQNDFLGVPEGKFLHQIYMEEHFGSHKSAEEEKKALASKKAAIGFSYEDSNESTSATKGQSQAQSIPEDEDSEEEFDLDLTVAVDQIDTSQMHEINAIARKYGLGSNDFMTFLTQELDEQEELRQVKEEQREKAMYSGRKARRERRAFREKRLLLRRFSPPSYASRGSPTYNAYTETDKKSRSPSPELDEGEEKIQYITSFGGDSEDEKKKTAASKGSAARKSELSSSRVRRRSRSSSRSRRRSRSRSRSRRYRSRSRDRRSRSRSRRRRRSRQRSRSRRGRRHSYSRSRSRSRSATRRSAHKHRSKRSRSRSRSRTRISRQKSRSRTPTKPTKLPVTPIATQPVTATTAEPVVQRSPTPPPPQLPPPPIKKYYGARKGSSSELDSDLEKEEEERKPHVKSTPAKKPMTSVANSSNSSREGATKAPAAAATAKLTPQERLKRKLQAALNKQFKADKKAERSKVEKAEQERMDREEELKELAIKLRRKERFRRHQRYGDSRDSSSSGSSSRSQSPFSDTKSRSPLPYPGPATQGLTYYPPPLPPEQTGYSAEPGPWNPAPLPPQPSYHNYGYDSQEGFQRGYLQNQDPQHPYHAQDGYPYYGGPSGTM